MKYEPAEWKRYSQMGLQYVLQSTWFSRYQGAIDIDRYIRAVFAKPRSKKKSLRRVAMEPNFVQRGKSRKRRVGKVVDSDK